MSKPSNRSSLRTATASLGVKRSRSFQKRGPKGLSFAAHLAFLTTPELLAVADEVTREANRRVSSVSRWLRAS